MSTSDSAGQNSVLETIDFGNYYLDVVQCPLNPDHKLRRHRLPTHLIKCKKNYPDKVQCPYGQYHFKNKEDMANHLQTCPDKPKPQVSNPRQQEKNNNITYNYDVENYEIDEPYWD